MIKTPLGILKVEEVRLGDFPRISIILCDQEGNEIDKIAHIEYDSYKNVIATYSFKQGEEDFSKRCVYKRGDK